MKVIERLSFGWETQVSQYPTHGSPGISYFRGDLGDKWVDCLLHRDDNGELAGILNYYSVDLPPENAGNFTLMVRPDAQRTGVATGLLREAFARWDIDPREQTYTQEGVEFMKKFLRTNVVFVPNKP
jgi:GNAT superfamily N-acetyltransferase